MPDQPGDAVEPPEPSPPSEGPGSPVGRRTVLGLLGLGAAGIVGGSAVQERLSRWLAPIEARDPTGLVALIPLGDAFRFYSVVGSVPRRDETSYRLRVGGLVDRPMELTMADLRDLPELPLSDKAQLRISQADHPPFGDYMAAPRSAARPSRRSPPPA